MLLLHSSRYRGVHTDTEARRGSPEKESVLPDHSPFVASHCWPGLQRLPPLFLIG